MSSYLLSPAAEEQLVSIYLYTLKEWGEDQADLYLDGLYDRFDQLTAGQIPRRVIPEILGVDGFVTRYEKHFIYWRELPGGQIAIVAILHERMHQIEQLRDSLGMA